MPNATVHRVVRGVRAHGEPIVNGSIFDRYARTDPFFSGRWFSDFRLADRSELGQTTSRLVASTSFFDSIVTLSAGKFFGSRAPTSKRNRKISVNAVTEQEPNSEVRRIGYESFVIVACNSVGSIVTFFVKNSFGSRAPRNRTESKNVGERSDRIRNR